MSARDRRPNGIGENAWKSSRREAVLQTEYRVRNSTCMLSPLRLADKLQ